MRKRKKKRANSVREIERERGRERGSGVVPAPPLYRRCDNIKVIVCVVNCVPPRAGRLVGQHLLDEADTLVLNSQVKPGAGWGRPSWC